MPPQQGGECIFCQLLDNPEQTFTVHETDDVRAWIDVNPRARGHTLVLPKEHLSSAEEVNGMLTELFDVARIVGEKAKNGLGADGYSIVMNDGEAAGQKVDHFYLIVFPRFAEDENAGTPTGAIFPPMEDADESMISEWHAQMEDAPFNDYSGAHSTTYTDMKEGQDTQESPKKEHDGFRLDDRAEFK